MALHQTKKQSDLEKRIRLLRQQVYGSSDRSEDRKSQNIKISEYPRNQTSDTLMHRYSNTPTSSDITYLYQDLLKIGILATLAIGIQIILSILTKNHVLNLNFF